MAEYTEAQKQAFLKQARCEGCGARVLLNGKCPNRGCRQGRVWLNPQYEEGERRFLWWRWPVLVRTKDGISDSRLESMERERDDQWRNAR